MNKNINRIKTFGIAAAKALATLILSILVLIGSLVLLVFQVLSWPFMKVAQICAATAKRAGLVANEQGAIVCK